jgi:hypothetical protein
MCRRPLDYSIWDANPGERLCEQCVADKATPAQKPYRVYMTFFQSGGWYCQFLEEDLKTSLPKSLTFATPDKVIELIGRGGGIKSLEDQQAVEYAVQNGRGGMHLILSRDQYAKLRKR